MTRAGFFSQRGYFVLILGAFSLFSLALLFSRIHWTGRIMFLFLGWNLFLAWLPWVFSRSLLFLSQGRSPAWLAGILFLLWLLFFPNAPYILTDLFHLKQRTPVPLWYDLVLILSFAMTGMLLGLFSLLDIQIWLLRRLPPLLVWIIVGAVLLLGSFGIYVGRYLRWNSWDILLNPLDLLGDMMERILHPGRHPHTWGMTLSFWMFLFLTYLVMYRVVKSGPVISSEKTLEPTA